MNIFLDSDVVVSALLSQTGTSYQLIQSYNGGCFISSNSFDELNIVCQRLKIPIEKLQYVVEGFLQLVPCKQPLAEIKETYQQYTFDIHDSHIVAGAKEAAARFLITYNIKHYKIDKINTDFNIVVLTPGKFLQYLRSL